LPISNEIHGILNPDIHALPAHRRVDMGGVAGEKNTALPVMPCQPRFISKARNPYRITRAKIPAEDTRHGGRHLVE
jgi:hypothetical protein